MCGIAGLIDFSGYAPDSATPRLEAALARLAPRGPDGAGRWGDGTCLLGHRRLAIVDLSQAGAQPMRRDGLAVVFNGMIYNYRALQAELSARGYRFNGTSDTEVLLAGWREWGRDLLPRLQGMFAFAIWDEGERVLHLARDPFGKKPLLYRAEGGTLAFASDLRALDRLTEAADPVDPAALRLYFALGYVPEPWTILAGNRKLAPGHYARFSSAGLVAERWYDVSRAAPPQFTDRAQAAGELRRRIEGAVAGRLIADVPVGAFLSGGIDSAIVAAAMTRAAGGEVRTYTVGFAGASDYYEERPAARRVAEHLGTRHTEIEVAPAEALTLLDKIFDGLDEPFADSSAIPTFILARETRRHVTVALSGDGGDEVFGGYRKHQGELHAGLYRAVPRPLRRWLIEPLARLLPEGKDHPLLEMARRARRFAAHAGGEASARQAGWMRLLGERDLEALLPPSGQGAQTVESLVEAEWRYVATGDAINRMLLADLAIGLPGDMLAKVDRMSMANSLEVRCPLLDRSVVEAAAAIPGAWKVEHGRGKAILREAFADALPAEVFQRPKKGFEMPLAQWLRGPLAERMESALAWARRGEAIRPDLPAAWWTDHRAGRRDRSGPLWAVIAFAEWQRRRHL